MEHGNFAAWVEGKTCNNEDPSEPGRQILLHFIMEVAREGCLQLSDGGNQERYSQDGNSAANLTCAIVPESSTTNMLNSGGNATSRMAHSICR